MLVQVDEARSDHEPGSVDLYLASELTGRDRCDLAATDSDIPNSVEARLRIHDAAAAHDHVVVLCADKRREQQDQKSHRTFILPFLEFGKHPPALRWYLK